MGLRNHRYKLPKTYDNTELDRYYDRAAEAILAQLKFSWTLEPPSTIKKKPPLEPY
jgi:hypothetical protein